MTDTTERRPLVRGFRAVEKKTTYTRAWIHNLIRDGKFPAPIMLGPNSAAWPEEEIDAWIASRPRRIATPKKAKAA